MLIFNALGFSPNLLKGIEELGFTKPTPIQEKIIPLVFENKNDVVGLAQTGTGKTAAFGLPLIEQIQIETRNVQVLVLAPTRELCIQIALDLQNFAKYIPDLHIVPVYGGADIVGQMRTLKKGVHIIVATPGRMIDLINRKAADISTIKTVVLDEADEMLNMGFKEEIDEILEKTPSQKRTLLFSATMSKEISRIAKSYLNNPIEITVGTQNSGADNIRHIYYQVHAHDRYLALKRIADINPEIYGIVFCRTRMETKEVADKLIKDGYNADALHGDLSQAQRDLVMKRFRERNLQMLVATDVAARGIDVSDITHVINYNLPEELEVYTHRSGRTGRAEKSGVSISIVNYREVSRIPQIEKNIRKKCERLPLPTGEEICKKQLFNLIDRMENVDVDEQQIAPFMEVVNKKLEWLSKEEIIKHFVSLEFNRFIEYYRNAPDLNEKSENNSKYSDKGQRRGRNQREESNEHDGRSRRESGGGRSRRSQTSGYTRFFMNIGKKDGVLPKNIIGMINDCTHDRQISIGDIELKDNFSFFEIEQNFAEKVLKSFRKVKFNGREVRVEIAEPAGNTRKGNQENRRNFQNEPRQNKRKSGK